MASLLSNATAIGALPLPGSRRHLVLSLPNWATDSLKRADPALARAGKPLALWEKERGAMKLAAVDALARAHGLMPGHNLADARAQVPGLEVREIDRAWTTHIFEDFADWHSNASPLVAVLADESPYGDLCLDITGVAHLFGGEAKMLATLTGRLAALGYTVTGAIADTIGAAWALAHFAPGAIVATHELPAALANLPVAALRLSETQTTGLTQLGLKQIGQLYHRDRKSLQARFGASLILRLDQALGHIEERLKPRIPAVDHYAERRFAEPIGLIDDVLMCAEDLAVQLAIRLEAEGLGAQGFHLFLYLVDHKVISLSVNSSRAMRDAKHIASLFKHRAERLAGEYDPGFGIDLIRLGAGSISPLDSSQSDAFGSADGTADLDRLFDRMTSRLGPLAVVRSKPVNTHIPERAVKLEPMVARTGDVSFDGISSPEGGRPLRLLPAPEAINVIAEVPDGPPKTMQWRRIRYRFGKVSGPERIEAEWWRSGKKLALNTIPAHDPSDSRDGEPSKPPELYQARLTRFAPETVLRDYYVAEDDAGRRFWIFREGLYGGEEPRWFLHGLFA